VKWDFVSKLTQNPEGKNQLNNSQSEQIKFRKKQKKRKMGIVEEAHNVRVLGRGEKIVVLGHGFGTDQSVWKHLVPHLVDEYSVILYDNMGAGTTNPDYFDFERYSTLEGFAYDLLAILEEVQLDSCIFVGHSFSAMIGSIASIIRPDLFSKILMLSPTPRMMSHRMCKVATLKQWLLPRLFRMLNDVDYYGGVEREDLDQIFKGVAQITTHGVLGLPHWLWGETWTRWLSKSSADIQYETGHNLELGPHHISR
ncbi:hypothetical protein F2P56_013355, partial [Juglans regia]